MSLLGLTIKELLDRLTSEVARDPNATAGWVNIRKEGFPWRHMVMDAERGHAEVSRVGRKLMARETEIDRWLSTKDIRQQQESKAAAVSEAAVPEDQEHDRQCTCPVCLAVRVPRMLRAQGHAVPDPTPAEIEEKRRWAASPAYKAEQKAKQERADREHEERNTRQAEVLAYLADHPEGITARQHCQHHGIRHNTGYPDLSGLADDGKLKRVGKGPDARFYLIPEGHE